MKRTSTRITALVGAGTLALSGFVGLAGTASAGQLDGPAPATAPVMTVTPVDPQPTVAGHEGDVLLQVSLAMPAQASVKKTAKRTSRESAASAHRKARR